MGSITDQLLSGNIGQEKKPKQKKSIVDQLLDAGPGFQPTKATIGGKETVAPLYTGKEPTGAISTITNEPITRPVDVKPGQQAGFGAMIETGFVDDPGTQMDILSKRMGIPRDRFGVVEGKIVYMGDDGKMYPAMPSGRTPGGYKRFAAGMVSHSPEIVLGTLGASGGPFGAALGSIGGAGIRQGVGSLVYNEPQKTWGEGYIPDLDSNIGELVVAGGTAALGEKVLGGGAIRAHDVVRGREGAALLKAAGRSRAQINPAEVKEIEMLSRKHGIDLVTPQTTRNPELVGTFNLLGDMPETAEKVYGIRRRQFEQINDAIGDYLDSIAPSTTSPGEAGRRAAEASQSAVDAPRQAARKASQAYYDEAKQLRGIDIAPTVEKIDGMLGATPRGGAEQRALTRIRNMITRKGKDADGNPIDVLEDRVAVLDKVKKEVNGMWKKDPQSAPDKEAQGAINAVLDDMLSSIDKQAPVYGEARRAYAGKMQDLGAEELRKSKLGQVAKLGGDKAETAAHVLFSPGQSSPEAVAIARQGIVSQGGEEAWNGLLRVHVQNALDSVKETMGGSGIQNIGGRLRKKLFGDPQQRKIMKAAMTKEQYQNFDDFMKVLDRAGLILQKESATATRQVKIEDLKRRAEIPFVSSALKTLAYPMRTPLKTGIDKFHDWLFTQQNKNLLDLMSSPKAARQIQNMLRLKPGSQKLLRQLGTFVSTSGAVPVRQGLARSRTPDSPPPASPGTLVPRR